MILPPKMPGKNRWKGDLYRQFMTEEYLFAHRDFGVRWISKAFGCKWDFVIKTIENLHIKRCEFSKIKTYRLFDVTTAKNFIDGLLIGDASLRCKKCRNVMSQSTTSEEWCDEIRTTLKSFGVETKLKYDIRENKRDAYVYYTLTYINLIEFHRRWYEDNGSRKIPNDINLTPTFFRNWVFSDGTKSSGGIILCSERFTKNDQENIVLKMKQDLGLSAYTFPHINKTRIRIHASSMDEVRILCQPIIPDMVHKFGGYKCR